MLESAGRGDRVTAVLGAASHPEQPVPATLHASLMARARPARAGAKETAQISAAIGREFSYELLTAVTDQTADELQAALDQLVDAGLIFRHGTPPDASYNRPRRTGPGRSPAT